jgi:hypothetical protein
VVAHHLHQDQEEQVLEVVLASQVLTLPVLAPQPMLLPQNFLATLSSTEEVTPTEAGLTENILRRFS